MNFSSKAIEEAVEAFAALPGVGRKTALRLVLFFLQKDKSFTERFTASLSRMKETVRECEKCFNLADTPICSICSNPRRDKGLICIVESIRDVMAIEETGQYHGLYHVLGGVISPIDGIGPSDIKIDELLQRVNDGSVGEVIMAISPTIEGETTIFYITKKLKDTGVKISTIARGVAFGGELQYTDEVTLGRSIVARVPYKI